MKLKAIAVALVIALLLSGCSPVGLDAQTLMRPPKATGERENIHALLQKKAGDNLTLKYPRSGDYRSAIIMHDFTGDGQDEAVALYQSGDDSSGINIVFINKVNGQWNQIGSFHNSAAVVDKICFGDVNGDGKDEVIVGWGNAINSNNDLCVYTCSKNKISELQLKQSYNQMAVMDFDDDSYDEIFTASLATQEQPAIAKLLRMKGSKIVTMGTAPLDASVTKYAAITAGRLNEKQYGVVLDGLKSASTMITEVLYWDKSSKSLLSPFFGKSAQFYNYTLRNTTTISQDINNDKIIEIPVVKVMPGYSPTTADESCYITNWHRFDTTNNTLVKVMSMVINSAGGYWLMIPDMWRGKITVKTDAATQSMTFYEWKSATKNKKATAGAALLKIEVFTEKEWSSSKNTSNFFKLLENNKTIYAASIPQPSNALSLRFEDVKNSFKLISQD